MKPRWIYTDTPTPSQEYGAVNHDSLNVSDHGFQTLSVPFDPDQTKTDRQPLFKRKVTRQATIQKTRSVRNLNNDTPKGPKPKSRRQNTPLLQSRKNSVLSFRFGGEPMSPLLALRKVLPKRSLMSPRPEFNAKEKWTRARNILKAIHRLGYIAREIQLYGSPAFVEDERQYNQMVMSVKKNEAKENNAATGTTKKKAPFFIIYPDSAFKILWAIVLVLLVLYGAFITPIRLAFLESETVDTWWVIQLTVDILLMIDVVVNCCSAFYNEEGKLIKSHRKILWEYAHFWLWIDLLVCFPFSQIFVGYDAYNSNTSVTDYGPRIARLYELLKMLVVTKVFKIGGRFNLASVLTDIIRMNSITIRLLNFIGVIVICTHFFACIWCYITTVEDAYRSWVAHRGIFDESKGRLYLFAFYWAVTTMFTVGYGDITPNTNSEIVVTIFWMMMGVSFYSFLIGSMSSFLNAIDAKGHLISEKFLIINEFCKQAQIDPSLKDKMKKSLEYRTNNYYFSLFDKNSLLENVPYNLRYEIGMKMQNGLLQSFDLFKSIDVVLLSNLIKHLQPLHVEPGAIIYRRGDKSEELYFIVSGRVDFYLEHYRLVYKSMIVGSYFGDYEVLFKIVRKHTIRAKGDSNMLTLNKKAYRTVIEEDFPEVAKRMEEEAREKNRRARKCLKIALRAADERIFRLNEEVRAELKRKEKLNISQSHNTTPLSPGGLSNVNIQSIVVVPKDHPTPKAFGDIVQGLNRSLDSSSTVKESETIGNRRKPSNNHLFPQTVSPRAKIRRASTPINSLLPRQVRRTSSGISIAVYDEHSKLTHFQERVKIASTKTLPVNMGTEEFYLEFSPSKNATKSLKAETEEFREMLAKSEYERAEQNKMLNQIHGQVQEMRIRMRQVMDENERLRKMYKMQMQPPKIVGLMKKSDQKEDKKAQWGQNLRNLTRKVTPLPDSLSGEEHTARELLDDDI